MIFIYDIIYSGEFYKEIGILSTVGHSGGADTMAMHALASEFFFPLYKGGRMMVRSEVDTMTKHALDLPGFSTHILIFY